MITDRTQFIGASDVSVIMGCNPWKDAYTLYLEKIGEKVTPDNPAMKHGREMEPIAREAFCKNMNREMVPYEAVYLKWPRLVAHMDGISFDKKEGLEIKCPVNKDLYLMALDQQVPPYYYYQIQTYYMCEPTLEMVYYYVYYEGHEVVLPVVKFEEEFEEIEKACREFWNWVENKSFPVEQIPDKNIFEVNNNVGDNNIADDIRVLREKKKVIEKELQEKEKLLTDLIFDKNIFFELTGLKLSKITRPGNVDYKKLLMDYKINESETDRYRKKSIISFRFDFK